MLLSATGSALIQAYTLKRASKSTKGVVLAQDKIALDVKYCPSTRSTKGFSQQGGVQIKKAIVLELAGSSGAHPGRLWRHNGGANKGPGRGTNQGTCRRAHQGAGRGTDCGTGRGADYGAHRGTDRGAFQV